MHQYVWKFQGKLSTLAVRLTIISTEIFSQSVKKKTNDGGAGKIYYIGR